MPQTETPTAPLSASHPAPHPAAAEAHPPAPQKRRFPIFLLIVPILALIGGLGFYLHGMGSESTDDAFIEGHVIQVSPRVPGHIQRVYVDDNQPVTTGTLLLELDPNDYRIKLDQARASLEIVRAKIEAARSNIQLTSGTTSADVEQASSGVDVARSAVESAKTQIATAESMRIQADAQLVAEQASASEEQANVRAAEAEDSQAQADLVRFKNLAQDQAISRQQLDQATNNARAARARLDSARQKANSEDAKVKAARAAVQTAVQKLAEARAEVVQAQARVSAAGGKLNGANTAPHQVAVSRSQLKALDAELAQAQAAVDQAQLNLDYTKVYAPEAGRVTHKNAEPGNYVQAGQSIMGLVPRHVWVVANFKETQLAKMRPGQSVQIEVDAYPGLDLSGTVQSIQAGTGARFSLLPPENASGNFVKVVQRVPVKILLTSIPQDGRVLAPGMSVIPKVKVN